MADGPATWGTAVRSNRPGVYLVELPNPPTMAPIDFNAVGRWIEHVPTLTLDGVRPTGRELAARLHGFWLPGQPVLYIGMSAVSIGKRVAAYQRTVLGERKPHAGGYWLKALSGLDRLRIWWADTDAPEEYEDALFGAFTAAVPADLAARLYDPAVILPFANLQSADKVRKTHGITGALLAEEDPGPVTDAQRRAAADPKSRQGRADPTGSTGVLRSRTALKSASSSRAVTPRPRATPTPRASRSAGKPAKAPTRLSVDGVAALEAELLELTTVSRPAIVARIVSARELGDLKENSDYQEARREQSFAEGRVLAIEQLLRNVELIEEGVEGGRARLGSTLVVEGPHGEEETFSLVGPTEANPAAGRISSISPIGAALLGSSVGDEVEAIIPSGRLRFRILEVR